VLYPAELTRDIQILLGIMVILMNFTLYGYIIYRSWRRQ